MAKKLVFLGTGGTIAGTATNAADNVGYRAAQLGIDHLLGAVPGLQYAAGGHELLAEQVAQVDSKDMGLAQWSALAQRAAHWLQQADVTALVVTHGTDTIEETAFFLSQVLPADLLAKKPVVLTCAMRPASSLSPDGPQNMLDAVVVASTQGARGVLVVCAGRVHSAKDVQKVHTYARDAFDSGEAGPVAVVEEGVVRLLHSWPEPPTESAIQLAKLPATDWPRVEIVMNYVGATGATVRALCAPAPGEAPVRGLVIAGTGNGTLHADLEAALRQVQAQGVRVLRASRCSYGRVIPGAGVDLLPHSDGLSPVKARVALMLALIAAT
jgi:L-asparaginase